MALSTNDLIEIELHMIQSQQVVMNVFQYRFSEFEFGVTLAQILPAWWSHVKTTYRALAYATLGQAFQKVVGRQLNAPTGELAEFGIPEGEQTGTRTGQPVGEFMPVFNTSAVRLLVSTRATRPGQKRVPFLHEGDNSNGLLGTSMTALMTTWCNTMTSTMALGAPAALTALEPIVTRKNAQGLVTAHQLITGYLLSPYITTQNSRKIGRGI